MSDTSNAAWPPAWSAAPSRRRRRREALAAIALAIGGAAIFTTIFAEAIAR